MYQLIIFAQCDSFLLNISNIMSLISIHWYWSYYMHADGHVETNRHIFV